MQQLAAETSTTETPSGNVQQHANIPQAGAATEIPSDDVQQQAGPLDFVPQAISLFDSVVNPALQAAGSVLGG